ncbi:hypothetical protein BpHYR1_023543, partial [Brachionus plicatilis]
RSSRACGQTLLKQPSAALERRSARACAQAMLKQPSAALEHLQYCYDKLAKTIFLLEMMLDLGFTLRVVNTSLRKKNLKIANFSVFLALFILTKIYQNFRKITSTNKSKNELIILKYQHNLRTTF